MIARSVRVAAGLLLPVLPLLLTPTAGALAQSVSIDLGTGPSATGQIVRLVLLVTVLSLAPSLVVMATAFTRIVIVLSFLRTAIGLQQTPPNPVLIGLALFLTGFIMAPAFETAWRDGLQPLIAEEVDEGEGLERTIAPFRDFMRRQVRAEDVALFLDIARATPATAQSLSAPSPPPSPDSSESDAAASLDAVPLRILLPAFMISELRRSFEIGFIVFVPFLVIDMVVASILMSMGMMMLPPVMISLPFKIVFFVLVDGWSLVVGSLVQSFGPL